MSLSESQFQNAPPMLACPKCGFMNYDNEVFCRRCQIKLSVASEMISHFATQRAKGDRAAKILNAVDFLFIMMSAMGVYWYYFDRNGARTLAQKQFRMTMLLAGGLGTIVVWVIKLARKRSA